MTNVVRKGAGRPAAAARTKKAAQRTPLPRKAGEAGKGTTAKVIKDEVEKQATKKAAAKRTTRAMARDELVQSRKRGDNLRRKPTDPKPVAQALARSGRRAAKQASTSAPKRPVSATTGQPRKAKRAASAELPADFPGRSKIVAWRDYAEAQGWAMTITASNDTDCIIVAELDNAQLVVKFFNGRQNYADGNLPYLTVNGHTTVFKNVAAARAHVDGSKPASTEPKVRGGRRKATEESVARGSRKLPKWLEMSDDEILAALVGHEITWRNHLSDSLHSATVVSSKHVKLEPHDRDTLILRFTDDFGFHAVALDRIVKVS
jgi:hypothetical protein